METGKYLVYSTSGTAAPAPSSASTSDPKSLAEQIKNRTIPVAFIPAPNKVKPTSSAGC